MDLDQYYKDTYDGYSLQVSNNYIKYTIDSNNDHNLVCLMAKEACNCVVCQGIGWEALYSKV